MTRVDGKDRDYVKAVDDALNSFEILDNILQGIDNGPDYRQTIQQIIYNLQNIKSDRRLRTRSVMDNITRVTYTAREMFPYLRHYRSNRLKACIGFSKKQRTCNDLFRQLQEREYMLETSLNSLQPLVYDPSNPTNI
ncbi:hypothetical protein F5B22DRAFT_342554 [Xylaria bambusicola]|uniref:uncharacterized protein n=1 Tax=Xylaria bambusicola TaxID=326684 RepID=UPI002007C492|nr:uncharacterized protein F5B22DRAFT_342554 [Xylaria bambusicola]KAI0525456.1 hypothetical protein F5B22DRAFT_342554 [Xylaria bambusicola]